MRTLLLIGAGGFVGSVLRYLVAGWIQHLSGRLFFPWGTFGVNVLGCLGIGLLGGWTETIKALSSETRLFLIIGLLGGFTTFSTFGYETIALVRDRQFLAAVGNVMLHVFAGLGAVWLGHSLAIFTGGR